MSDLTLKEGSTRWTTVLLEQVSTEVSYGYTASSSNEEIGPKMLRITDIQNNTVNWNEVPYCKIAEADIQKYSLAENDIVFARTGATVGKSFLIPSNVHNSVFASYLIRVRLTEAVLPKYISYFFQSGNYWLQIRDRSSGIGQPNVNGSKLKKLAIPLAPPEQQRRIVAKIEELFSHIDAGIAALNKAKQLLKQYRQSVLKAAVTGELTKQWREDKKYKLEPASQLLERILQERRKKWETQQIEQFKAQGKLPKDDNWKRKYSEPESGDTLPFKIPDHWESITLDYLLDHIEAGKSFRCEERPPIDTETGIVKVSAVSWGEFDSNESKTITDKSKINNAYRIHEGDLLFSRANTIDLVGACVIVKNVDKDLLLSDKILRLVVDDRWKSWLLLCLRSWHGRKEIENLATGNQDSMRNIGQARIKRIGIPLLTIEEMELAVAKVGARMDAIYRIENEIDKQITTSAQNKQSILASAFCGDLL